jgi:hypothetical protein
VSVYASALCGREFFCAFWPRGRRSRGDLLLFGLDCLASVEIVNGALRVGCCCEDCALVILQDLQPALDIGGMIGTGFGGQGKVSTKKGCAKLCDQFFLGIARVTPLLAAKISVKAALVFGPVGQLMGQGCIVGSLFRSPAVQRLN